MSKRIDKIQNPCLTMISSKRAIEEYTVDVINSVKN